MRDYEWDENKRNFNLEKHGVDFKDAIEIFNDHNRIEAESIRKGEKRYQTIGMVNQVVMLLVYVSRSERKRIISARKASKNEREVYYKLRGEK